MTDELFSAGLDAKETPGGRQFICYRVSDAAPKMVPAASERAWMDETPERFAYRCLPLTIANGMGWELLLPFAISAEWNGGAELSDIAVSAPAGEDVHQFAASHFGSGILTFQTHYLFRTEPAIALWVRGSPNRPKDGIAPLDGIVETDWLTFTFTMNWMFTRPGRVDFAKDEPYRFITPVGYHALDEVVPEIRDQQLPSKASAAGSVEAGTHGCRGDRKGAWRRGLHLHSADHRRGWRGPISPPDRRRVGSRPGVAGPFFHGVSDNRRLLSGLYLARHAGC